MGQSLSTLISTSFQYVSARRGCHSLTEAVYLALLSFLGLISSFHNISPVLDFLFLFEWLHRSFGATLPIITNSPCLVKQFFRVFCSFLKRKGDFFRFFVGFDTFRAVLFLRLDGHHQIFAYLFFAALYGVRGHRGVEQQHCALAVYRL